MRLTIDTPPLADAAAKAAVFCGKGFKTPIWLHAENGLLTVHSTDGSLDFYAERPATVESSGFCGVAGDAFASLLKTFGKGELSLSLDTSAEGAEGGAVLHLAHGRRKLRLACKPQHWAPEKITPPDAEGPETIWNGREFTDALRMVQYCAAKKDSGGVDHCVHFRKSASGNLEIAAMNGHSAAVLEYPAPAVAENITSTPLNLAGDHLQSLTRWLPKTDIALTRKEKTLLVRDMEMGETLILPCNVMQYLGYEMFMARKADGAPLILPREDLAAILDRARILADQNVTGVDLLLSGAEAAFSMDTGTGGTREALPLQSPYSGQCTGLILAAAGVRAALEHFTAENIVITLTTAEGPVFLHAESLPGYVAVTMPMKQPKETYYDAEGQA